MQIPLLRLSPLVGLTSLWKGKQQPAQTRRCSRAMERVKDLRPRLLPQRAGLLGQNAVYAMPQPNDRPLPRGSHGPGYPQRQGVGDVGQGGPMIARLPALTIWRARNIDVSGNVATEKRCLGETKLLAETPSGTFPASA